MTNLGTLGEYGSDSAATAINNVGQIVGYSIDRTYHAFLWQNGITIDLGTLGGTSSFPADINDQGQIVGWSTTANGAQHVFLWQNGVMTDLGTLGGSHSIALAINEHGQIVGQSTTATGEIHPFLWQNGVMTDLGTLGGNESAAYDINEQGQIVGHSTLVNDGGIDHAFLWQNGIMTDLGTLGGSQSYAYGINDQGQVVGYSFPTGDAGISAVLWTLPQTAHLPEVDIKPGSVTNLVNLKSKGIIPVALLTTSSFDASEVDPLSVRFGPSEAREAHGRGHLEDVDADGDLDLMLHFRTQQAGLQCGMTSASLSGTTKDAQPITGSDSITLIGCP